MNNSTSTFTFRTRFILGISVLLALVLAVVLLSDKRITEKPPVSDNSEELRESYANFLENHPFRTTMNLSKEERLDIGLPPNKFYEQEWLYTSDPSLQRPAPEKVHQLQKELAENPAMRAAPGTSSNNWEERGPDNVGGRTHTLMFAPGSTTKVFAGGVSGGLWVNNNITSSSSVWQQVAGVPGNLAVMCITVDPNDNDIMYLGTGEVYTWGAVNGNGVYKSTDGGDTWTNIYSGGTTAADKITYVQDIVAWNNPVTGQTEVFFGVDAMAYTEEVDSNSGGAGWNWLGANTIGLYRSTDGVTFNRLTGSLYESSPGDFYAPNDFDIGADGTLWMGTKYSYYTGEGGGVVFNNDGNGWQFVRNLGDNGRVELACSQQDADKIYALCEDRTSTTNPVKIYRTTNGFSTSPTSLSQPNDADTGISANDFTRGQSFYDLLIGVDPNNDNTLYVGGIDLFKSTNSGNSWSQFSHWYGGFGYQYVHADQHGIAFANSSRIIFGNDGGVFYTNNGGTTTSARNNGYNVTQFYKAAINQPTGTTKLLAGAQDNGSQLINGAAPGVNSSTEVTGGDGCWAFVDQDSQYMISSYVYNNYRYITYGGVYVGNFPGATNDGDFVNQCGLDSATNILLSNGTSGTTYRIYRWAINPAGPSVAKTTLTNAMLNAVPTYFTASPYTSDRFLVGTALGKIIRMNNVSGSPTWTDISIPGQIGAVSDIRYGQSENEIMVTFHNYGVTSIWYTTNGASGSPTWISKEGNLPDMPVKCILQNPLDTNEVIVGTELGVWKTNDFNNTDPTWVQSQNGMSDVKVLSFDYRSADRTILASTFGRGMFTGQFENNACGVQTTYSGGSWDNGAPTSTRAAFISSNYDTAASGDITACTLVVRAGATVTVRAGDYLDIDSEIIVDGTLIIEHEGSVVQTDKDVVVTNNGTINVNVTTPVLQTRDFMVMGSPMTEETRTDVFNSAFLVLQHTPANFIPHPGVPPGGTNFADDNGDFWNQFASGPINIGEGYIVRPQTGYTDPANIAYNFTYDEGTLNNGDITRPVVYNGGSNPDGTPNVFSNPYPSAISATDFINGNALVNEVYFWEHLTPPSSTIPGANGYNFSMDDISMYNLSGGVAAANDPGTSTQPNGFISTAQGFGIKAFGNGTVTFTNSMRRTTGNNTLRTPEDGIDRIWLSVTNSEYDLKGNTMIAFNPIATEGIDAGYDSERIATFISLFSHREGGNEELGIQTREAFNPEMKIAMGFASQVDISTEYTVSISDVMGNNISDVDVYLIDNELDVITNLSNEDYTFRSNKGTFPSRFSLLFEPEVLDVPTVTESQIAIVPNPTNGPLEIISGAQPVKSLVIYDLQGRRVENVIFSQTQNGYSTDLSALGSSMYFVQIEKEDGTVLNKKILVR